jgi:hypothetical protein
MIEDKVNASGEVSMVLRDAQGNIKETRTIPNSVVTVGKGVIASRLTGVSTSVMSYMAVGTNSTATAAANTTLGAEIASSRTALTTAGGVATNNVINFVATFGAGVGTGAIVEAGIFNASSAGSMLCRTTFLAVNKDVGDSLTISWNVTIN